MLILPEVDYGLLCLIFDRKMSLGCVICVCLLRHCDKYHVISTGDVNLSEIRIMYNHAVFDHFPLFIVLKLNSIIGILEDNEQCLEYKFIDWDRLDKNNYISTGDLLCGILTTVKNWTEIYRCILDLLLEASEDYAL